MKKILLASILWLSFPTSANAQGLLSPNPGLAIWTLITFFILLIVLGKFAWKPLIESLENRTSYIEDLIANATEKNKKAEQLLGEYELKLEKAHREALEIIEEGKRDAEALKNKNLQETKREVEALKSQAQKEIELAKAQAKEEIWEMVTELSISLAEKIIERSLRAQDDREIIKTVLRQYQKERSA